MELSWVRFENLWSVWMLGFFPSFTAKCCHSVAWQIFPSLNHCRPGWSPGLELRNHWIPTPYSQGNKAFWVVATSRNLPCQRLRALLQPPKNPSFPDSCFVWLLGYWYFCNDRHNYKNKNVWQAAKALKARVCVWGCELAGDHPLDQHHWLFLIPQSKIIHISEPLLWASI